MENEIAESDRERVSKMLREKYPDVGGALFMGVPLEQFDRDDVIRMLQMTDEKYMATLLRRREL